MHMEDCGLLTGAPEDACFDALDATEFSAFGLAVEILVEKEV
jgi:hypothetical protein